MTAPRTEDDKDRLIEELTDALVETLEIASRNESGPYIRRALDAIRKARGGNLERK